MAYIDTSVLAACYCAEPLTAKAERAVTAAMPMTISPLVEVELYSAVSQKVRGGQLDPAAATRTLSGFAMHVADGHFRMVAIGADEYALARDWLRGFATALRTADALHLAAAANHGMPLLTADQALAKAAQHFGVKCKLVS